MFRAQAHSSASGGIVKLARSRSYCVPPKKVMQYGRWISCTTYMKSSKSLTTANVAGLDLDLWHPCLLSSWCGVRDRIIWGKECGGRSSNLLLIHTPPLLRRKWRNCLDSRIYPVSVACLPFRHICRNLAAYRCVTKIARAPHC